MNDRKESNKNFFNDMGNKKTLKQQPLALLKYYIKIKKESSIISKARFGQDLNQTDRTLYLINELSKEKTPFKTSHEWILSDLREALTKPGKAHLDWQDWANILNFPLKMNDNGKEYDTTLYGCLMLGDGGLANIHYDYPDYKHFYIKDLLTLKLPLLVIIEILCETYKKEQPFKKNILEEIFCYDKNKTDLIEAIKNSIDLEELKSIESTLKGITYKTLNLLTRNFLKTLYIELENRIQKISLTPLSMKHELDDHKETASIRALIALRKREEDIWLWAQPNPDDRPIPIKKYR